MKLVFSLFLMLYAVQSMTYAQDLNKAYSFSSSLDPKISFEDQPNTTLYAFANDRHLMFSDFNLVNFQYNPKRLNSKLFLNATISEHRFRDYSTYFRGCGPLKKGITNPINSDDLMLSMIIDNFVNNVLFPKGVFFRN